jgi:uncharacterized LabA/DUF88 family protein
MPNRTVFLVDGFNLYHSLRNATRATGQPTRWLDLNALCASYLHMIGSGAKLEAVYYFTALAYHREPHRAGTVRRHRDYIAALESTGVLTSLAQFKRKDVRCPHCRSRFDRYEEKETDVAVAAKLLELAATDGYDTAVIVSGDTDLIPAIRTALVLQPKKRVCAAFPAGRVNAAIRGVVSMCFKMKQGQYAKYQLPDPVMLPDGRTIAKPAAW